MNNPHEVLNQVRHRRAILFGALGWLPWFGVLCAPGNPLGTAGSGNLGAGIAVLFMLGWGILLCGIGSLVCRGRTQTEQQSSPRLWRIALLLNYGFFLCPIAFFILTPVVSALFSSGSRPISGP